MPIGEREGLPGNATTMVSMDVLVGESQRPTNLIHNRPGQDRACVPLQAEANGNKRFSVVGPGVEQVRSIHGAESSGEVVPYRRRISELPIGFRNGKLTDLAA